MRLWRGPKTGDKVAHHVSEQEIQIRRGLESMRESTAREVMTPRVDVIAVEVPVTIDDVARAVRRSGHSQFPVYEEDLDNLRGVLFVKDLFMSGALDTSPGLDTLPGLDVGRRVREPYVVTESRPALEILAEMRRDRRAFAVVVDEHGGVAGVITMTDLVGELVGDLHDEYDQAISPAIKRVDRSRYLVDGACGVDEVRDEIGVPIPDGDYVTLGGYVLDALGRIPAEGEQVHLSGWTLRVTEMDRRRIAQVVVQTPAATMS